jgi:predicted transcriptional regulator
MSGVLVLQFASLGLGVMTTAAIAYLLVQERKAYDEQQDLLIRTISALMEFQKQQRESAALLKRVESDGRALQKVALNVEATVTRQEEMTAAALKSTADRQTIVIDDLRDHLDIQEQRLYAAIDRITESVRILPPSQPGAEPRDETPDHSRHRRETLNHDPALRFAVLKDWISVNILAILRRASRGWTAGGDLIGSIPAYLQPEAEILNDSILLISTRGHTERLAVPLRVLDSASDFCKWFDHPPEEHMTRHVPAVLSRSNGHFELVSKGTNATTGN